MNTTDARSILTEAKELGEMVLVRLADDTSASGAPISVNTKGVNIKMEDGKTKSFSLNRVKAIDIVTEDDEAEGTTELEDIVNEISDGATTAEIAAHLTEYLKHEVTPKELRVHLRALGLGVGKGRKYALSAGEFRAVLKLIDVPA